MSRLLHISRDYMIWAWGAVVGLLLGALLEYTLNNVSVNYPSLDHIGPGLIYSVEAVAAIYVLHRLVTSKERRKTLEADHTLRLIRSWAYDHETKTVRMTLSGVRINQARSKLQGGRLFIVARVATPFVNFEEDLRIAIGEPRTITPHLNADLVLQATIPMHFASLQDNDIIEVYLLFSPSDLDVKSSKTIRGLIEKGGELLERVGVMYRP